MAANTVPIFTGTPAIGTANWTASNPGTGCTDSTTAGTVGTNSLVLFTAGSAGSFLTKVRWQPCASSAGTNTTGTVGRLYYSTVNTGATTTANTHCIGEVTLPQQTADSSSAATNWVDIPLGIAIPSSSYILVSMHVVAAANTAWQICLFGGNY